jgi:hypothetical protein
MKLENVDSASNIIWWQLRRGLKQVRDWLGSGDNPYSPLLSLSVLLVIGVIAKTWH